MTLEGADRLQAKLRQLVLAMPKVADVVAAQSVAEVSRAVRADIGDTSMSGWPRRKPMELKGMLSKGAPVGVAEIVPYGKTAGPFRVLESGRNTYNEGDRRNAGTYLSRRTGIRRQRTRVVGRSGFGQAGKGTWSDAEDAIERQLSVRSAMAFTRMFTGIFGR